MHSSSTALPGPMRAPEARTMLSLRRAMRQSDAIGRRQHASLVPRELRPVAWQPSPVPEEGHQRGARADAERRRHPGWSPRLPQRPGALTTTAIYANAVGEEEQSIAARTW